MLTRLKIWIAAHVHDNWRDSWKWGSVRLHALATAVLAYIVANPGALNNLVYGISPQWRFPALLSLAGTWFALGWVIRVWQGKPNG